MRGVRRGTDPESPLNPGGRIVLLLALAVLLAASLGAASAPHESAATDLHFPVALPGLRDAVLLEPHDPRSAALRTDGPAPAAGLYAGHLHATGARVALVIREEAAFGVLASASGATWVTVADGVIVPYVPPVAAHVAPAGHGGGQDARDLAAPGRPEADARSAAGKDGVLQILLESDARFHEQHGEDWADAQLAVIHLVDAIFQANLGIPIEVVEQHTWTEADPEPYAAEHLCTNDAETDLLWRLRNHWEATRPTTSDPREATLLLSGVPLFPTNLYGCAYIRQLETSWAYGVSTAYEPPSGFDVRFFHRAVLVAAHELGHNFDGRHERAVAPSGCLGGTLMHDTLCHNAPVFTGAQWIAHCHAVPAPCPHLSEGNAPPMRAYALSRV